MPRFEYNCPDCKEQIIVTHDSGVAGFDGCPICGSDAQLERVYSFSINKAISGKNKPGILVKSHIEEAKESLRKEKEQLFKKEFKA